MAIKDKLHGSFGSLLDTLSNRFDPLLPEDIVATWTSTMARSAACARNVDAWDQLPGASGSYDGCIEAIDDATRALVTANDDPDNIRGALQLAGVALGQLEALLAGGCAP
jgi:hypothetical protein